MKDEYIKFSSGENIPEKDWLITPKSVRDAFRKIDRKCTEQSRQLKTDDQTAPQVTSASQPLSNQGSSTATKERKQTGEKRKAPFLLLTSILAVPIVALASVNFMGGIKLSAMTHFFFNSSPDAPEDAEDPKSETEIVDFNGAPYFCDENSEDIKENPKVVARSDLGNIRFVEFSRDPTEAEAIARCQELAQRLREFHAEKNIGYLSWSRTPEGVNQINISQFEGNIHSESEEYIDPLMTLWPDDQVHEVLEELHGVLSSDGNYEKDLIEN